MGLFCLGLISASCTPTGRLVRPVGLEGLVRTFGEHRAPATHAGRTTPSTWGNGQSGQSPLAVHQNFIPGYVSGAHQELLSKTDAAAYTEAAWSYNCRLMTGSSTKWSAHAWGVALDFNTVNNPYGQAYWRGLGGFPTYGDRGTLLPAVYQNRGFYWGLNSSTPDPMHFQYVEGY